MNIIREAIEEAIKMANNGFTEKRIVMLLDSLMPEGTRKKIARRALRLAKKPNHCFFVP